MPSYAYQKHVSSVPVFTLDHAGPMAWTAEDCALLLQAMAGHDPADPASADRPVPDYRAALDQGIRALRIGVVRHFHEDDAPVNDATAGGLAAAQEVLRRLGADLR